MLLPAVLLPHIGCTFVCLQLIPPAISTSADNTLPLVGSCTTLALPDEVKVTYQPPCPGVAPLGAKSPVVRLSKVSSYSTWLYRVFINNNGIKNSIYFFIIVFLKFKKGCHTTAFL